MSDPLFVLIGQGIANGLVMGGAYALLAMGLTLTFGVMDIVNLAHGEFTMLGMYFAYFGFTLLGIDPYLLLIPAIPIFLLFGMVVERYLIEPIVYSSHTRHILLTTGISLFLQNFALFLWTADYRSIHPSYADNAIRFGGIGMGVTRIAVLVIALLLSGLLYLGLQRTDIGKAIRGCANQREAAHLCGINVRRIFSFAFGIGATCAAAAGILIAPIYFAYPAIGGTFMCVAFVIIILGGTGNILGALIGGFIVGLGEAIGELVLPGATKQLVTYSILVLILLVRPSGLLRSVHEME